MKTCAVCVHSCQIDGNRLQCRRNPPQPSGANASQFPTVHPDTWCGEYRHDKAKAEKKA